VVTIIAIGSGCPSVVIKQSGIADFYLDFTDCPISQKSFDIAYKLQREFGKSVAFLVRTSGRIRYSDPIDNGTITKLSYCFQAERIFLTRRNSDRIVLECRKNRFGPQKESHICLKYKKDECDNKLKVTDVDMISDESLKNNLDLLSV